MKKVNFDDFFLSYFSTGERLQWQLDNKVNLVDYLKQTNTKFFYLIKIVFSFISKTEKERMFEEISCESILNLLKREKPHIYEKIINYPGGKEWVGDQVNNFKDMLRS